VGAVVEGKPELTPLDGSGGERASRLADVLAWSLLALNLVGCLVFLTDRSWRPEWDGATYLLAAQSLARGEGYLYQGEPFYLRPPGLPWLLSFVVGPDGFDAQRVNLVVMAFAGLVPIALFLLARLLHGAWIALVAVLLAASSAAFVQLFDWVFAEYPYLVLAFLGMYLCERAWRAEGRWWIAALGGAACLAAATYMRTVAVLLLPGALLLGAWRGRGLRRLQGALVCLIACALVWPWQSVASARAAAAEAPVEQDLLHDYATAMFHVDPGDPSSPRVDLAGWQGRVRENGSAMLRDLATTILHSGSPLARGLLVLLLFSGLAVTLRRRGPSLLEWFFATYAVLVATYFSYDGRLLMPVALAACVYLVVAVWSLGGWLAHLTRRPVVLPLVAGASCAGLFALNLRQAHANVVVQSDLSRPAEAMARWLRANTPPDARVMCNQAPIVALLSGRRTFTFRFLRAPDPLTRYAIDYVLLDAPAPEPFMRLVQARHLEHWTVELGAAGRATVVRVR